MVVCAVNGCHNASYHKNKPPDITFHAFPTDPLLSARWTEKIRLNRNDAIWKPTKHSRICSVHFDEQNKYTSKNGLRKLRRGTVPNKDVPIFINDNCNYLKQRNPSSPQPGTSVDDTNKTQLKSQSLSSTSIPSSIFDTPKKASLRQKLKKKAILQRKLTNKIKALEQKTRRLKKKNESLQNILTNIRNERYINNDLCNILSENVFAAELYNSMALKSTGKKRPMPKYTPEFRSFCLTLHFYSPRAYSYVRKTFNTCLPHPKTIYNWYRTIDGSPGFTDESFQVLKSKTKTADQKIICALIADEMAIRPQNFKGGEGRVDLGTGISGATTKAKEAYTFMLVCLNEHWKIPLGYFLVNGLSGAQKVNLIKMCLTRCEDAGVKVVALTFDGHATNTSTMQLLGCHINDPDNMKTTFKHPTADHDVAVFLDPCHMIKLVRNHLEEKKTFLDQDENKIEWEFFEKLNNLQEKEGLHIANKLTRRHLQFRNSIMKVKLAAQLLSRSVAVAFKFCREELKLDGFKSSQGTEKFVSIFNDLFDIFNTRRLTQHGLSHPLSNSNKEEVFDFLDKAKKYILALKVKNTRKRKYIENATPLKLKIKTFESALTVKCSPGFKGLLVCIESLKHLFNTLVEGTNQLRYITTYRLSQDHIELFFGSIRMQGGHNDNPNALQFKGSYRKLMCHMELQVGSTGNCVPLEDVAILTCSSALKCINSTSLSERFDDADEQINDQPVQTQDDIDVMSYLYEDPSYKNYIVGYLAGNVVRHIITRLKCNFCTDNMLAKEKMWFHKLVALRDKGGLLYATKEVYYICCVAESCLRNHIKENPGQFNVEKQLALKTLTKLIGHGLFPTTGEHVNSRHHDTNLAKLIIERYLRIRFFYESKKENLKQNMTSKRQLFRKQLQFQGF